MQETERRHIAHELHDEVGQALTALKINLHTVHQRTADESSATHFQEAMGMVDRIMQQVRSLSLELRPPMMDDLGLLASLRWHVKVVTERTGLPVQLDADVFPGRLSAELEMACFRVVQEALNNVVKYAKARAVRVELRHREGKLHLSIRDDGVGFDVAVTRKRGAEGDSLGRSLWRNVACCWAATSASNLLLNQD